MDVFEIIRKYTSGYVSKTGDSDNNNLYIEYEAAKREVERLEERARSEGKELVLLCFEDIRIPSDWCHRTVFAQWWAEKTGEIIEELYDPNQPKGKRKTKEDKKPVEKVKETNEGFEQMNLFDMLGATGI